MTSEMIVAKIQDGGRRHLEFQKTVALSLLGYLTNHCQI